VPLVEYRSTTGSERQKSARTLTGRRMCTSGCVRATSIGRWPGSCQLRRVSPTRPSMPLPRRLGSRPRLERDTVERGQTGTLTALRLDFVGTNSRLASRPPWSCYVKNGANSRLAFIGWMSGFAAGELPEGTDEFSADEEASIGGLTGASKVVFWSRSSMTRSRGPTARSCATTPSTPSGRNGHRRSGR
jgi:hypothetical protein